CTGLIRAISAPARSMSSKHILCRDVFTLEEAEAHRNGKLVSHLFSACLRPRPRARMLGAASAGDERLWLASASKNRTGRTPRASFAIPLRRPLRALGDSRGGLGRPAGSRWRRRGPVALQRPAQGIPEEALQLHSYRGVGQSLDEGF